MPVRLLFEDEGRFGRISDTRRCWVPLPHRAVVGQQVVREYLYSVATVCPQDGSVVALILPWVDAETMSLFLQHAAAEYPGEFCLMFLDRAAWHCAGALQVPASMRLLFLPPYSPELNPVEHLWDHLRENYFGNQVFHSLDDVETRLCQAYRDLFAHPELVRSLTRFEWMNTLPMMSN
jgi:hypothetical protein